MKPRQTSPQPELLRMRAFKLETAAEPPKIQINEVFAPNMGLNGFGNLLSDPETPTKQNGESVSTPPRSRIITDSIPSPTPPRPPSHQDASPSDGNTSPWSAAVGRATNGKSGRVIERLMGENDRLQREMALVCAKFDEESKRSESARSALESLRESNENLLAMHETDKTLLVRKDRKIDELKEELESQRLKREHAESETKETRAERDTIVQKLTKESLDDKELAKRSTAQYEVLSRSWKGLEDKYDRQAQTLRYSVQTLQDELTESKQKLDRIDLITEQLKQEGDKIRRSRDNMARDFEAYKQQQEDGLAGMKETAQRNNEANERLFSDVTTVLGEMKYVMNLKKDVKSFGNGG